MGELRLPRDAEKRRLHRDLEGKRLYRVSWWSDGFTMHDGRVQKYLMVLSEDEASSWLRMLGWIGKTEGLERYFEAPEAKDEGSVEDVLGIAHHAGRLWANEDFTLVLDALQEAWNECLLRARMGRDEDPPQGLDWTDGLNVAATHLLREMTRAYPNFDAVEWRSAWFEGEPKGGENAGV